MYNHQGQLPDGRKVAVKKLIECRLTNKGKDFTREVQVMSKLMHPTLVELLFYCQEGGEWILVYEYMQKKSLDLYIFGTYCVARRVNLYILKCDALLAIPTNFLSTVCLMHLFGTDRRYQTPFLAELGSKTGNNSWDRCRCCIPSRHASHSQGSKTVQYTSEEHKRTTQ